MTKILHLEIDSCLDCPYYNTFDSDTYCPSYYTICCLDDREILSNGPESEALFRGCSLSEKTNEFVYKTDGSIDKEYTATGYLYRSFNKSKQQQYRYCEQCGAKNQITNKYCHECGYKMRNLDDDNDDKTVINLNSKRNISDTIMFISTIIALIIIPYLTGGLI